MRHFILAFLAIFLHVFAMSQTNISGIINDYAAVTQIDFNPTCGITDMTVDDASPFSIGDTVLIIQMQGASISTANNAFFGNVSNYNAAGLHEKNVVAAINGNTITFEFEFLNPYQVAGTVQIVSIPHYINNVTVNGTLTAQAWNGSTGGILIFSVDGTLTLQSDIDLDGLGFRGGANTENPPYTCNIFSNYPNYAYPLGTQAAAGKGEGVASFIVGSEGGRGKQANGGGGGNDHNSGGGGGSNGGAGGVGGITTVSAGCTGNNPGVGGLALDYSTNARFFLGGGGGAGHGNNSTTNAGNGGGLVMILAEDILPSGGGITANGTTLAAASFSDGGHGGGAGGSVVLVLNSYLGASTLNINVDGANGVNSDMLGQNRCLGPGGGGAGGFIALNSAVTYPGYSLGGGNPGVLINSISPTGCTGSTQGALAGQTGVTNTGYSTFPVATVIPTPGISVDPGTLNLATVCETDGTTLTPGPVGATGYTWQIDSTGTGWVDIVDDFVLFSGANTDELVLFGITEIYETYNIRLIAYNACDTGIAGPGTFVVNQAPIIDEEPTDIDVCVGGDAYFVVESSNGATYQWFTTFFGGYAPVPNAPPFSGSQTDSLHISGVTAAYNGSVWRVNVMNPCGVDFSDLVNVNIVAGSAIDDQSGNLTVCENADSFLYVSSSLSSDTYQWQVDAGAGFVDVVNNAFTNGATNDTLDFSNIPIGYDGNVYRVIVTDVCGTTFNSAPMILSVLDLPSIALTPDQTVCEQVGTFITATTPVGAMYNYVWQIDTNGIWEDLSDDATYSNTSGSFIGITTVLESMHLDSFRVIATNSCGVDTSTALVLLVNGLGVINNQPQDTAICIGDDAGFSVDANNIVSYQWQSNEGGPFANISNGATYTNVDTANLLITAAPIGLMGVQYQVVMVDECGNTLTSAAATLLGATTPIVTDSSLDLTFCESADTFIYVTSNATSYQWLVDDGGGQVPVVNNATYSGSNNDTLFIDATTLLDGYAYQVQLGNACGASIVSSPITLHINPTIFGNPFPFVACDSAQINGNWYFSNQTVQDTFVSAAGCDSIDIVNLTINNSSSITNAAVIACDSAQINGNWYFTTQTVLDTSIGGNGCNVFESTDLTINNSVVINNPAVVACDSALVNSNWYFTSQIVNDTFATAQACDSIEITDVTINNSVVINNPVIVACDSALVNGNWYLVTQIVNDTFTTSLGCDSIEITDVTINNEVNVINPPIVACDSAQVNSNWYFATQIVMDTFTAANACDSIETTDVTINNSVVINNPAVVACDSALVNSNWYFTSQIVNDTFATAQACDSIEITDVTINNSVVINNPVIVACDSALVNGNWYLVTQIVNDTFTTSLGCDSIEITDVTINNEVNVINPPIVACDSAQVNSNWYFATQIVMDTFTAANACDSIETTDVTINNSVVINNPAVVACDSALVNSNWYFTSQIVNDTFATAQACDSIEITDVTINNSVVINNPVIVACDSALVNGNWYLVTQIVNDTFITSLGCDSIEITDVTINNEVNVINPPIVACDSAQVNSNWYFATQIVMDTFTAANACDSIETTDVTINNSVVINNPAVVACDSALVNSNWYFTSQIVNDTFATAQACDSIEITDVTINNSVTTNTISQIACDSAQVNGNWYFTTQMVMDTFVAANGCDSIDVTNLTINNSVTVINPSVIACDSAQVNGNWYFASQTVTDVFVAANFCDSTEITDLTINNSVVINNPAVVACDSAQVNGNWYFTSQTAIDTFATIQACDSIEITDITINNSTSSIDPAIVACDSAQVHGNWYFTTQIVLDTFATIEGCDSIVSTNLTINNAVSIINPPVVACDSAQVNSNWYFASQVVMDTFMAVNGCDSIETTDVTINFDITLTNPAVVGCDSAQVNGNWYFTSQMVTDSFLTVNGCDSIEMTDVTINNSVVVVNPAIVACDSAQVNGNWYNISQLVMDTFSTSAGCDSIETTDLTINNTVNVINPTIAACDSAQVNSNWYFTSQIVMDTFMAANGCDSIETTELVISYDIYVTNLAVTECDSALVNGNWYFTTQLVTDTFVTSAGCDSIEITDLTINNTVIVNNPAVIACDSAQVNSNWYFTTQMVMDTFVSSANCDSIEITDVTINNSVATMAPALAACDSAQINGNWYFASQMVMDTFVAVNGCDSIVTTDLTINNSYIAPQTNLIACDSAMINGAWYFASQVVDFTVNGNGTTICDSTFSVDLTINNTVTVPATNLVTCDSAFIEGNWYNSSQVVNFTRPGNDSTVCDSLFSVNLTINITVVMPVTMISACDATTIEGVTYTTSQMIDSVVFSNVMGICDTIFPIDLTILNSVVMPPTAETSCDSVLVNGTWYTTTQIVNYTTPGNGVTVCDSTFTVQVIIEEPVTITDQSTDIIQCGGFNVSAFVELSEMAPIQWQIDTGAGFVNVVEGSMSGVMTFTGANDNELVITNINTGLTGAIVQAIITSTCPPAPIFTPITIAINEPMPLTNIMEDFTVCLNEIEPVFVDYVSTSADWSSGDFGQYFVPSESGEYTVTFIDSNACPQADTINVTIEDCIAQCYVTAPTGFSPNSSGTNDIFRAIYGCDLDVFKLSVYDRWGTLIYYTEDPTQGWDGTFQGKPSEIGAYSWYIDFRKSETNKIEMIKGNVTLIR